MKNILVSLSALLCFFNSAAQIKFDHYSIENGLSQSVVLDIVQDKNGFLWFATQDGLNRFDGYEFKVFKNIRNDSTSISDNWINAIAVGKNNCLWLATESGGVCRFDLKTQTSENFKAVKGKEAFLQNNIIRDILEDKKGNLWVATWGGGVSVLRNGTNRFETYRNSKENRNSVSDDFVRAIYEDENGTIWVGTKIGLGKFNSDSKSFENIYSDGKNKTSLTENFITAIFKDSKQRLWVGTREGLNVSSDDGKTFRQIKPDSKNNSSINDKVILTIYEDSNHNIWIGTYSGGLNKLVGGEESFEILKNSENEPNSLSGNYVRTIYEDHTGLLWVGTWGNGLNKINLKPYKFKHVSVSVNGLNHKFVRSFFEDKNGSLWIGTLGGGINIIDSKTGKYGYLKNIPEIKNTISNNDIYSMVSDKNGQIWIGTNSGLNSYNPETKKIKRYLKNTPELPQLTDDVIRSVVSDKSGNIWIGNRSGIIFYDTDKKLFTTFKVDSLPNPVNVSQLLISSTNELWVSVRDNGVFRFSLAPTPKIISHYTGNSISHNNVLCMYEDSSSDIWLGTASGLNKIETKSGIIRQFSKKDGLPNDVIYGMAESENGILWISTNSGLSRFDPNRKDIWGSHFRNYDLSDGLQSNEFNTGSVFKSESGELFFGGINGYNRFYPSEIKDNLNVPPVVFSNTKILDHIILPKNPEGENLNEIVYHYDDKIFSFEMASLDFTRPEKNQYAYKLSGFDSDWNFSGNRRFANYTNLDPGTYSLQIMGSNNDGIWNQNGETIQIKVIPPFWMTWWFRILLVLLVVVIPVLIYVNRIQKLLELERLRVRIASDLHDDVGGSLTKISLHADLINAGVNPEKLNSNLETISSLSREVIRTMSDIVWAIDARNDTAGNMIDRMRDFAAGILNEKNISLKFEVSGLESSKKVSVDTRQNLYLILKEAVNNSVKYSEATEVKIIINQSDGKFSMSIADNGKGISGVKNKTGHGLGNIQMRSERLAAKVEMKTDNGFEIRLERKEI